MGNKHLILVTVISSILVALFIFLFQFHIWVLLPALIVVHASALILIYQLKGSNAKITRENNHPSVDTTLQIAHETLPFLRRGLNETTAPKICEIIQKIAEVPAVAITDTQRVLAFLGVGCDKHQPGDRILTAVTKEAIATGKHKVVLSTQELSCSRTDCDCPLSSAVIVPLFCRNQVIGALKLYQTEEGALPPHVIRLAIGIGQLLSMQTELAELDRQAQLVTMARLEALHAQINPHFFFNTLNTIIMYSRTNPDKARRLLIHLADFFRQTLKRRGHYLTLREELDCVHTYLVLEKARFGDKLQIVEDIPESLLDYRIPVLSIQPLVENAVKHGITPKTTSGTVKISAHLAFDTLVLSVADDGVGIPSDKLESVLQPGYGSGNGVGLSNVNERLISLYGENHGLRISSQPNKGTTVTIRIPLEYASPANGDPKQEELKDEKFKSVNSG